MTAISQRSRPVTFAEVIGQDHVTGILAAAVRQDRLGHAYLFSGPRGVGKTTSARLLAMAVSCSDDGDRPCGHCEGCRLVAAGSHPDVIELDAASNNSVEDIRDLREKVGLASMRGGHRVWILDEAHMLSRAAANALLKTLEEPPPRLMFILATTEPEKLPPTVLSRCQHYRFRRLSDTEIQGKLEAICAAAGVAAEPEALALVARSAEGAMRDAESLLERLLAPGAGITREQVTAALGLPPAERLQELASAVASGDLDAATRTATALYHDGFAPRSLAERLNVTLRDALMNSLTGEGTFRLKLDQEQLMRLIECLDDQQERFIRRDDLFSLEVTLIRAINSLRPPAPAAAVAEPARAIPDFDPLARPGRPAAPAPAAARSTRAEAKPAAAAAGRKFSFHSVREQAGGKLRAFLAPARDSVEGTVITLEYPDSGRFHYSQLMIHLAEFEELVRKVAGSEYSLDIRGPGGAAPAKKP